MPKTKAVEAAHGDTQWFTQARFGLFIHWGLYSMAGRHEWVMHREEIPVEAYERKYFKHFNPDLYDPRQWAADAAAAGMKYFVITTKHHEGFCLWDSKLTDYKAPNTPAQRDLLRPMVEAFRAAGLRVGLYHSLIDWHHPHYVLDPHIGPYRQSPRREELNRGRDQMKYADYLHGQVRELLTSFGDVDVLWLDFSYPKPDGSGKGRKDWRSEELHKLIRKLRPTIVLNDRLDLPGIGDVRTPEQFQPRAGLTADGKPIVWEACQTLNNSWGYHADEAKGYRGVEELIGTLIDTVSKGGNLLLNVGPTARGTFDPQARERLAGIGRWMTSHSRAIHGCTQAPPEFVCPPDCRLTYNPDTRRLYVHLLHWPYKLLYLDGLADQVEYAQWLHDGAEARCKGPEDWQQGWSASVQKEKTVSVNVPIQKPDVTVPVVEFFLKDRR